MLDWSYFVACFSFVQLKLNHVSTVHRTEYSSEISQLFQCITLVELMPDLILLAAVCGIGKRRSMANLVMEIMTLLSSCGIASTEMMMMMSYLDYWEIKLLCGTAGPSLILGISLARRH